MASTSISRTPSSTGNRQTWTFSAWVKRSQLSTDQKIFEASPDGSNTTDIRLKTDDTLQVYSEVGGVTKYNLKTNRKLRDTSAWYHVVIAVDTTQGTSSNRVKLYINGVQETSFSTATYPDQNFDTLVNFANQINVIGRRNPYSDFYFNGLISYAALVDGTQELPTIFGETDSVTGQWKIKTDITPSVAWGTNGFLILKNGNSLTDESTNSNNFTLGSGTLTNSLDCPSNVFATWNSLDQWFFWGAAESSNITNGNTTVQSGNSQYAYIPTTLGANSKKYYWEIKPSARNGGTGDLLVGVTSTQSVSTVQTLGWHPNDVAYRENGNKKINNSDTSYGNSYTLNDIIGVAMDLDNNKLYFSKNGVWQNSGDPTSGSTGTGAIPLTASASTGLGNYFASVAYVNGSYNATFQANFGNGFFGTSAVADNSTATASTPGTFNYDVPAGYQPLTTKGLNA